MAIGWKIVEVRQMIHLMMVRGRRGGYWSLGLDVAEKHQGIEFLPVNGFEVLNKHSSDSSVLDNKLYR
jgi:hypothetical protein